MTPASQHPSMSLSSSSSSSPHHDDARPRWDSNSNSNINKGPSSSSPSPSSWERLQPLMERVGLTAVTNVDTGHEVLIKWMNVICQDYSRLDTFRRWIALDETHPSSSSSSSSSSSHHNMKVSSLLSPMSPTSSFPSQVAFPLTAATIPSYENKHPDLQSHHSHHHNQVLLQQLVHQQQQQILLLQQIQQQRNTYTPASGGSGGGAVGHHHHHHVVELTPVKAAPLASSLSSMSISPPLSSAPSSLSLHTPTFSSTPTCPPSPSSGELPPPQIVSGVSCESRYAGLMLTPSCGVAGGILSVSLKRPGHADQSWYAAGADVTCLFAGASGQTQVKPLLLPNSSATDANRHVFNFVIPNFAPYSDKGGKVQIKLAFAGDVHGPHYTQSESFTFLPISSTHTGEISIREPCLTPRISSSSSSSRAPSPKLISRVAYGSPPRPYTPDSSSNETSSPRSLKRMRARDVEESEGDDDGSGSDLTEDIPTDGVQLSAQVPTPKQLMIVREKMLEFVMRTPTSARPVALTIIQQPSVKVVWKNRRLDLPFKVKIDIDKRTSLTPPGGALGDLNPSRLMAVAIVTDHKGKLQIDAVDNFSESFSSSGIAMFADLRMTKGTWGKEWSITFVAVLKPGVNAASTSFSNPLVTGVSEPVTMVVKTRKNPQVRGNASRAEEALTPPSPPSSPTGGRTPRDRMSPPRMATPYTAPLSLPVGGDNNSNTINMMEGFVPRHMLATRRGSSPPLIHEPSAGTRSTATVATATTVNASTPASAPASGEPFANDMASLLLAAGMKQQEVDDDVHMVMDSDDHDDEVAKVTTIIGTPSRGSSGALRAVVGGAFQQSQQQQQQRGGPGNQAFGPDLQTLLSLLEGARTRGEVSLDIIDRPMPKNDSVLTVKKGKAFRLPFRIQMTCQQRRAGDVPFDPLHFVCVATVYNDRGEEIALRNNEVPFDWRGDACFGGLMVMKGTWGKAVNLRFEARWNCAAPHPLNHPSITAALSSIADSSSLVVAATRPIDLLCFTKDKKPPSPPPHPPANPVVHHVFSPASASVVAASSPASLPRPVPQAMMSKINIPSAARMEP